jgi:hypothetical protein
MDAMALLPESQLSLIYAERGPALTLRIRTLVYPTIYDCLEKCCSFFKAVTIANPDSSRDKYLGIAICPTFQ